MTWMTIAYPMAIGACVTMALIHLRTGLHRAPGQAYLLFSFNALVVAVYACFELALACAENPAQYLALLRWLDIMAALQVVTTAAFVWVFFGTGRKWLALLAPAVTCLALIADLLPQPKLVFLQITGIRRVPTFGGATYTVADGVTSPWNAMFYLGVFLLVVFVADASVTLWRQGARRRAGVVGGAITLFVLAGGAQAALVDTGILRTPYLLSFAYLAILAAMGMELSAGVLRAAQLAQDLRESEARMSLASEAAGFGVWMWSIARNQVWGSARWLELFGFAPDVTVDFEKVIQRIHPDDRETVEREARRALADHSDYAGEYRVLLPDNTLRWIAARGRMYPAAHDKPARMLGTAIDVTERKQAEQEIAAQREEVSHLSRVTTLGEISGSLAHELNQPLGAMLVNTDSAQLHLQRPTPNLDAVRAILADIHTDGLRAGEIIHGMRAFLRRKELEMQPLEVGLLAGEAVKLISANAATRKTTVGLEIPPGLPRVTGDRVHLQQVLLNLLVNGMDAMSNCPVADRRITIRASRLDPHKVEIAVSDAGVGIPPGELDRVFTPFHTTKQGGLGLGLPICRSIVEAHGGSISINNNPDRGATARFSLAACVEGQA
jgi:PAS domain S-box-containing protein